jgi:thymidylate synthase
MKSIISAFDSLDEAFIWVLQQLLQHGTRSDPRGLPTLELFPLAFTLRDPRRRYISVPERRWSVVYAVAEFCWHARGSSLVDDIAHYAPRWRQMANACGEVTGSSYGARVFGDGSGRRGQWDRVLQELRADPSTRRAVLYFPNFEKSSREDVACAISLQFVLRGGRLDALATMRSNDAMLGMPYDVFFFSMLQEMVATELGAQLGQYHHVAGSLHIYENDVPQAKRIVASHPVEARPMAQMSDTLGLQVLLDGEIACRLHGPAHPVERLADGYWTDLLSVIRQWHVTRLVKDWQKSPNCIVDPVLSHLYSLRF